MRVVSKGVNKNWKREVTCTGCNARLEVDRDDCQYVSDQRDGDFWKCTCPECGHMVTIDVRLVGGK